VACRPKLGNRRWRPEAKWSPELIQAKYVDYVKGYKLENGPDPLCTIHKVVHEHYANAKAIFWAGSVSEGQGTSASDLDLVIVFDAIPNAFREAFVYDGWPIDAFIHDMDTLRYFFEESRAGNGISGLIHMILNGREVTDSSTFSENIKTLVHIYFDYSILLTEFNIIILEVTMADSCENIDENSHYLCYRYTIS
jgi:hypothetical protein